VEDSFAGIAADYDNMFPRDLAEDSRMLAPLFERRGVKSVLDCACGTGLQVAMLARQGYDVTGSDVSESMLALARQRLDQQQIAAKLVNAEWAQLPGVFDGRFDAVICIGNSLPLATTDEAVQESVRGMYGVLAPGGVLVIQNRNMDKMIREEPDAVLNEADDGYVLFVFDYRDQYVIYKIFYLVTGGSEEGKVTYNQFTMNLLTRAKFERMLKQVGAISCKFFGDSYLASFSASRSPRLITAVFKPGP
jgi:ubiquinone/menaquinone biosynthesis C-methylase UbiE